MEFIKGGRGVLATLKNKKNVVLAVVAIVVIAIIGYVVYSKMMANTGGQRPGGATAVKAMQVIQKDTPINYEYAGDIKSTNEVKITSRVSGTIVEKYITGGQFVQAGQPLYKVDSKQYESALLSAQANLAQAQASYQNALATLQNAQTDNSRYQTLLAQNAISEQQATTQQSQVEALTASLNAQQAIIDSNAALVKKAQEDLDDTVVYAPTSGKLDINDVDIGTYATAGSTVLVTMGSVDQVYAQFNVSEDEYLKLSSFFNSDVGNVTITLSDGTEYPITGKLVQIDRSLATNTGTLAINALFDNPDGILLPGMFARVKVKGEVVPNAILIPQRAVQQILEKTFVMVVGEDGKSVTKPITVGDKVGSFWIVTDGLSANDTVIVEGLTKLQEGVPLDVTMVTPEDLGLTF